MKSHKSLPKSVIAKWGNNGEILYLDIKTNQINKDGYYLNAEEKYYDCHVEGLLSQKIEMPYGRIRKKLYKFENNEVSQLQLDLNEIEALKIYANACVVRTEHFLKGLSKDSYFGQYITFENVKEQNIILYQYLINKNIISSSLDNTIVFFLKASGNNNFVLPKCNIYEAICKYVKSYIIVMPISPKSAIMFMPKEKAKEFIKISKTRFLLCDDKSLQVLNEFALESEIGLDNDFIIGNLQELELLKKYNALKKEHL